MEKTKTQKLIDRIKNLNDTNELSEFIECFQETSLVVLEHIHESEASAVKVNESIKALWENTGGLTGKPPVESE